MVSLGSTIKKLREQNNINQKDFAKKMNVSNVVLSRYESDERKPDYDTLQRIADYFNVTTDYLLGRGTKKSDKTLPTSTSKEERDIAKQLKEFQDSIENSDGLAFDGEPMSDEAKESLVESMEHIFRQTQRINKKYTPNKYKDKE